MLSTILCGWGRYAGAANSLLREAKNNPETTSSIFEFIVALIIYALIAAVIGGIVAGIAKFILNKEKDEVEGLFYLSGGIALVILVIVYFTA